jgi:hypothetical protein
MELADSDVPLNLPPDRRAPLSEPPPVRLVAVEDVSLPTPPAFEKHLDAFYVDLLRFEREGGARREKPAVEPILGNDVPVVPPARANRPLPPLAKSAVQGPVYRGENRRISFQVHEGLIERDGLRPLGVEVPSLVSLLLELDRREMEYTRQRGLYPGQDFALLQDPAGNWIQIGESRQI